MWMCGKWPQLTLDSWIIIPDWDFELSKVIWLHQTHLSPPCEHIHSAWTRWWWASLMSWFLLTMIKWKYKKKDENKNAGKKRCRQSRETTREVKKFSLTRGVIRHSAAHMIKLWELVLVGGHVQSYFITLLFKFCCPGYSHIKPDQCKEK